jgi:uncharacterized protein YjbI with pentapeptide repeats
VIVGIGVLFKLAIWVWPQDLVGPPRKGLSEADRLKALNDVRSPLVTAVGGLLVFMAALIGAYFTGRTIHVNREGQLTDRFTRAIAQLGDDKLDVRLGGIYALERIARESAKDHGSIMEVLTAFLREHAQPHSTTASDHDVGPPLGWDSSAASDAFTYVPPSDSQRTSATRRLRADFQAVATVLGRRSKERRRREVYGWLDLHGVDLRNAFLPYAHLEDALLVDAHLEKAYLNYAHLERASLGGSHLEDAQLVANLDDAYVAFAHLKGAELSHAHLKNTNFVHAHLERAGFYEAELEGASFIGACLDGASLERAHLYEVQFSLDNGDGRITSASLQGTNFRGAILTGADLRHTDLRNALGLTREQLRLALTDASTILPVFDASGCASSPGDTP